MRSQGSMAIQSNHSASLLPRTVATVGIVYRVRPRTRGNTRRNGNCRVSPRQSFRETNSRQRVAASIQGAVLLGTDAKAMALHRRISFADLQRGTRA